MPDKQVLSVVALSYIVLVHGAVSFLILRQDNRNGIIYASVQVTVCLSVVLKNRLQPIVEMSKTALDKGNVSLVGGQRPLLELLTNLQTTHNYLYQEMANANWDVFVKRHSSD